MTYSNNVGLNEFLTGQLDSDESFREALEIVRRNSRGKLWLVGGHVYKNLIKHLYGLSDFEIDFDFLVEISTPEIVLPSEWDELKTRFGGPRFIKGKTSIDYISLSEYFSNKNGLEPKVESYLISTPLTVQSIAFDIDEKELIGDVGVKSIETQTVNVNNLEMLKLSAKMKYLSTNELIRKKAEELRFTPIYPM